MAVADPASRPLQPQRPAQRRRRALVAPAAGPVPLSAGGHRRDGARTQPPRRRAADHRRPDGARCPPQPRAAHRDPSRPTWSASSTPAPDPSGHDVDIAPYLRDAEDLDVEVAWATWTPGEDGAPDPEIRVPAVEYRCRVPIGDVVALARDRAVWRFDRSADGWTRVTQQPHSRPRPGEVLLVSAADGGYDAETGFDLSAPGPVPDSPELLTPEEWQARVALAAAEAALAAGRELAADAALAAEALVDAEDDPDEAEPRRWQSLDEHSEQVRDQAAALLAVLAPSIPPEAARSAIIAGYLHDLGKAHEIWQDAICALADDEERAEDRSGPPVGQVGRQRRAALRRRRRLPPRARLAAAHRRPAGRAGSGIPGPRPH